HYYLDGRIGSQVLRKPTILGHEYAGIVEAVGAEADPNLVGKRVAVEPGIPCMKCEWCRTGHYNVCTKMSFPGGPGCNGALCERIAVHAAFCFPVPESMTAPVAAMIEPLAVALHTVELAQLTPGASVAIFGLGPIGLLTARVARFSGTGLIIGSDLHPYRVEAGCRHGADVTFQATAGDAAMGASATLEHILGMTQGRGVDVAIDCTNSSEGVALVCHAARPAGRCVLTGISGAESDSVPVSIARRRELTLQWCRRFRFNFPTAIALLHARQLDVAPLITHSFPLERAPEAFELVAHAQDNVLKASIDL
ncbi:MAG: alcohol dehydrogenase catalytic domain-containing protein, partial [Candidatus Hydrogenedentes bacterium]|nr:alcohol dehydrogenase catalytic domain-containing protein [Candidatus Hydrogenedentota bacterium]